MPHQITSPYDFATTRDRLKQAFTDKGMTIFAEINHHEAAEKVGLSMQAATVLIYGAPQAGTPLMIKDPSFALQLPLKVLITEVDQQVLVIFNKAQDIIQQSNISYADVEHSLANAEKLIQHVLSV